MTRPLCACVASMLIGCGGSDDAVPTDDTGVSPDSGSALDARDAATVDAPGGDAFGDAPGDTSAPDASSGDAKVDATSDTAPPPGKLLFVGDFETGDLKQWPAVQQCAPGRITVYSAATAPAGAPPPREGTYAVRFRILDTDVSPCTSTDNPRGQIMTAETLLKPGDDVWEAWAAYFPATFPKIQCGGTCPNGTWMQFQEDYGAPYAGSPALGWDLNLVSGSNHLSLDRGEQYAHDVPWKSPLVAGRWIDFLVHKKMSNTVGGGGFVEAWVDGTAITFAGGVTRLMTQTMHASQSQVGFFLNSYRAVGMFAVAETFYDGVRVGTTREIVELK